LFPRMKLDFYPTLADLPPGRAARITHLRGGRGMALRLARLGLRPGSVVRLVNSGPFSGPLLVEVAGVRVALGRGVARRILVQPLP